MRNVDALEDPLDRYVESWLAANRLSRYELARRAGFHPNLMYRWKQGIRPSDESLRKLAAVMDVPHADLMRLARRLDAEPSDDDSPTPPEQPDYRTAMLTLLDRMAGVINDARQEIIASYPQGSRKVQPVQARQRNKQRVAQLDVNTHQRVDSTSDYSYQKVVRIFPLRTRKHVAQTPYVKVHADAA
jgi:transcriptional regulator with XRE-family HTH domain